MRQIKFRAWDLFAKEMEYEVMIDPDGKVAAFSPLDGSYVRGFSDSEKVIMQHTGLQDSKGKGIYEGDILTSEQYPFQDDGKYNYHGVIEWIEEEASFYMTKRLANKEKRGMSDGISQPIEEIEEFEVIGNIYEHPHLLEGN